MFYLTTHSTHFIYGYMASDIWLRTILIVRKETRCRHIGYSYQLTARVLLYAPSHRQDNTYHGLCYTSRGALKCSKALFTMQLRHLGILTGIQMRKDLILLITVHQCGIFMHNGAPCHKSNVVTKFLIKNNNNVTVFDWPGNSSNLTPIEKLYVFP